MKNFVLTPEMVACLGEDISPDRKNAIVKALTQNWAFIVYPESMPINWLDILESYYIPFAVSPLHDKDTNPDGTPKKPHYHILLTSESKKSFSQLFEISSQLNGSYLINVGNVRGYYRYLIHLDNPEKYQYNENDIKTYCGFNPDNYIRPTSAVRFTLLKQMVDYIEEHNILYFSEFVKLCSKNNFTDWLKLIFDNSTVFISKYIDSRRNMFFGEIN